MNMKRAILFSGAITAIIVGVFSLAYLTAAAANKFPFVGRGIVKENNLATKTLNITFSHISPLAQELALGKTIEVHVGQAKLFKPNSAGTLKRVTQGNVAIGDEVSAIGNVRSDDRFVASKVTVRSRSFTIKGKLLTYDFGNKRMTVQVESSTYRPNDYNGGVVTIQFPATVNIFHLGASVEPKDVTATNQRVRVDGRVVNTDDFEATTMYENIP